jgi:death on curing protein
MIDLLTVLEIHELLIAQFGGLMGIRDMGLLQSAIERPISGFGETIFYETPEEKATAIIESIVTNHPFLDGNKRTGYVLMRLFLRMSGKDIRATQTEKYDFVLRIASGQMDFQAILSWIKNHSVSL